MVKKQTKNLFRNKNLSQKFKKKIEQNFSKLCQEYNLPGDLIEKQILIQWGWGQVWASTLNSQMMIPDHRLCFEEQGAREFKVLLISRSHSTEKSKISYIVLLCQRSDNKI